MNYIVKGQETTGHISLQPIPELQTIVDQARALFEKKDIAEVKSTLFEGKEEFHIDFQDGKPVLALEKNKNSFRVVLGYIGNSKKYIVYTLDQDGGENPGVVARITDDGTYDSLDESYQLIPSTLPVKNRTSFRNGIKTVQSVLSGIIAQSTSVPEQISRQAKSLLQEFFKLNDKPRFGKLFSPERQQLIDDVQKLYQLPIGYETYGGRCIINRPGIGNVLGDSPFNYCKSICLRDLINGVPCSEIFSISDTHNTDYDKLTMLTQQHAALLSVDDKYALLNLIATTIGVCQITPQYLQEVFEKYGKNEPNGKDDTGLPNTHPLARIMNILKGIHREVHILFPIANNKFRLISAGTYSHVHISDYRFELDELVENEQCGNYHLSGLVNFLIKLPADADLTSRPLVDE